MVINNVYLVSVIIRVDVYINLLKMIYFKIIIVLSLFYQTIQFGVLYTIFEYVYNSVQL